MENNVNQVEKKVENKWFMIHTYSGYEKKVKDELERKVDALGMREIVKKILVPEEITKELVRKKEKVDGKIKEVDKVKEVVRKLFPGYVMLEMESTREETADGITYKVDTDAWYAIRNTNGVTGFVGVGSDPIPMEDFEIKNIFKAMGLKEESNKFVSSPTPQKVREVIKIDFEVNDFVKVLSGGFEGHEGKVSELDFEHGKAKIMIEIFGRMTSVEVEFGSLKKAK